MSNSRDESIITLNETSPLIASNVFQNGDASRAEQNGDDDAGMTDEPAAQSSWIEVILLMLGLSLGTFTVALDNTIISTAIPKITADFDSLGDVGWYGSVYFLSLTAFQPSFGRIYSIFEIKQVYLLGITLFEIGSVVCATAKSSHTFIAGRAIAGVGEAACYSGAMTIIGLMGPARSRQICIAFNSSMYAISSIIGPIIGGVLTTRLSWRWCFWINLPVGCVTLAAVGFCFTSPRGSDKKLTFRQKLLEVDMLGSCLIICSITCLLLALERGGTSYPWSNPKVWGFLLASSLSTMLFAAQQIRRGDRATIPPRLLMQRTVFWTCLFSTLLSMATFTHLYYLPFYFQRVKDLTAEESGIRMIPYLASCILASILLTGGMALNDAFKPFMILGSSVFAVASGLIYSLQIDSGPGEWIGYQILAGIGAEAGVQLPVVAVQAVLSSDDMPTGIAMAVFFNSLGAALATSIAQNLFYSDLKVVPKYSPRTLAEKVIEAGGTDLDKLVNTHLLPDIQKAYMEALRHTFLFAFIVTCIGIVCACFVEWRSIDNTKKESHEQLTE